MEGSDDLIILPSEVSASTFSPAWIKCHLFLRYTAPSVLLTVHDLSPSCLVHVAIPCFHVFPSWRLMLYPTKHGGRGLVLRS